MRKFTGYIADLKSVLMEVEQVLTGVSPIEVDNFVRLFDASKSKKIVVAGAGRMGYAARGFAMRLGHMGFNAWMWGDSTVPQIGRGDLLVVASGSGNTQTIYDISVKAQQNGADIALITNDPNSRIGQMASTIIRLPNVNNKNTNTRTSVQPMSTLNEQCLGILMDTCVLDIMRINSETHDTMWKRHSNLE